jgi:hypothetical protein
VNGYDDIAAVTFTTKWQHFTASGKFGTGLFPGGEGDDIKGDGSKYSKEFANCVVFNLNDHSKANKYYFDNISFKVNGEEVIVNGDFESDDFSSFWIKECPAGETDATTIDKNLPVEVAADNIVEKPADTEEELSEEEKNLKYDTPKVLTYKGKWAAVNIAVEKEWASVSVTFDGKPENVQFCVSSDFVTSHQDWGDQYQATYLQIGDDGVGTVDLAAELEKMNKTEGDESTKITTIGIQYTADVEEGTTEFPTAKVLTVVATLKDGTQKLVKGLSAGWNTEVAK